MVKGKSRTPTAECRVSLVPPRKLRWFTFSPRFICRFRILANKNQRGQTCGQYDTPLHQTGDTYPNQRLVTSWRSPGSAPSKLQSLLGFWFGNGQQSQSQSSTMFGSSTTANRSAPTNLGSNTPNQCNDCDGVSQPPSDSCASLVQAQELYLQSQQAQADTPDIQFLQAEVDSAQVGARRE